MKCKTKILLNFFHFKIEQFLPKFESFDMIVVIPSYLLYLQNKVFLDL